MRDLAQLQDPGLARAAGDARRALRRRYAEFRAQLCDGGGGGGGGGGEDGGGGDGEGGDGGSGMSGSCTVR